MTPFHLTIFFLSSEIANRVLPALCSLTVDPEKSVRDPAFKTVKGFLGKLEKVSEDPSLRETMGKCQYLYPNQTIFYNITNLQRLMFTLPHLQSEMLRLLGLGGL